MIKLSMTLNGETLEKEFTNEEELIAAADEMKESRKKGKLRFKDSLHKEFYDMIQDNADGYRENSTSKEALTDEDKVETKSKDDLGFVKKAKVTAAEQPRTADAAKSASKVAPAKRKSAIAGRKAHAEHKYKEALAAAQAETEEYQKTVTRLDKELKDADAKHRDAKLKLEEAKREYIHTAFGAADDFDYDPDLDPDFYDLLDFIFGRGKDEE